MALEVLFFEVIVYFVREIRVYINSYDAPGKHLLILGSLIHIFASHFVGICETEFLVPKA